MTQNAIKHYAYPSTGQFKNTIKDIKTAFKKNNEYKLPVLTFLGTVKLHGTNASLYSDLATDSFVVQSKNNILTIEKDNYGFANAMLPIQSHFLPLFNGIKKELVEIKNQKAVIYGEWCGGSIQPNVGLSELQNMFVIFGIKIIEKNKDYWFSCDKVKEIFNQNKFLLNENNVFSIYDFPTWKIDIDFNQPQLVQNKIVEITNMVEKECPFSKQFGISGIGEGVVWRNITPHPFLENLELFFKVKGQEHSVSNVSSLAMVDTEKVKNIGEFVDKVVTENRLKQGIEYLKEQHLEYTGDNSKVFISWIVKDCFKEEMDMVKEAKLEQKDVAQFVAFKAKEWYLKNYLL